MPPKDPYMLLSWLNTQLRDHYFSLEDLCLSYDLDQETVRKILAEIDYYYEQETNRFIQPVATCQRHINLSIHVKNKIFATICA